MQHAKHCQPVKSHWAAAVYTYLCAARLCHLPGLKEMLIFPCRTQSWIQALFLPLSSQSFYHSFSPPSFVATCLRLQQHPDRPLGPASPKLSWSHSKFHQRPLEYGKESGLLLLIMVPPFPLKQAALPLKPVPHGDQASLAMVLQIRNTEGSWAASKDRH